MTLLAVDASPNGHDLAYTSDDPAVGIRQCRPGLADGGKAIEIKGAGHYAGDDPADWAKDSTTSVHIVFFGGPGALAFMFGGGANNHGWHFRASGSSLVCFHKGGAFGGYDIDCGTPAAGAWHLVSVGFSPTASIACLDDALVGGNAPLPGYTIDGTDFDFRIGDNPIGGQTYAGAGKLIDELVLNTGAYTSLAEHQTLWDALQAGTGWAAAVAALSPTGWWRLDDGCRSGWRLGIPIG